MDGQPHDIKVGALDFFYGHHPDPILSTISTGFIERFVIIHVEFNFRFRKIYESHFRSIIKCFFSLLGKDTDSSHDDMHFAREYAEHMNGFQPVLWFVKNGFAKYDY